MAGDRVLLDTAILVDLLRGHHPARTCIDSLPVEDRLIMFITAAELICGCRNRGEQRAVEQELADYRWLWMDEPTARLAIELYRESHLSHGVGFHDCYLAATAVHAAVAVATTNVKHFTGFAQLVVTRPY